MSCFPSPVPISETPDPARYERAMLRAAGRGIGSDAPDPWSIEDAAAFWLPGWLPPSLQASSLPADAVMGLATRAFLMLTRELPPIGLLISALATLPSYLLKSDGPYVGVTPHGFCFAAHRAFAPSGERVGESVQASGFRGLTEMTLTRCEVQECLRSHSLLGHCITKATFDNALRSGLLIPTRTFDAGPLTLLISRLCTWKHERPNITVRDGERHVRCLFSPYWVHDAMVTFARLVPALLADTERQTLMRYTVARNMAACHAMLAEPPRAWVVHVDRKTGKADWRLADRRSAMIQMIWQHSGATASQRIDLPKPLHEWFRDKPLQWGIDWGIPR